jgi:hypothetical protein
MQRVTPALIALAVLAVSGCQESVGPGAAGLNFALEDASHGNGTAHFYWSSPIVADPGKGGIFDPTYQPLVQVCEWSGGACVATVAEFRTGRGSGDVIRIDVQGERYEVNWNTRQCRSGACTLNPSKNYRVFVLVAGLVAGFADVDLLANPSEARTLANARHVRVMNGAVLPIRFRLERGLTLFNAAAPALPRLERASRRYRDAGVKPATGRDGAAVVQGRALLGADGTTLVELTTGRLGQIAPPPGNIEKVQFKQVTSSGEPVITHNFSGLAGGGAWSHTFTGFPRRAALEVQASITGIDTSRTSVVTVPLTVALRPDLEAKNLDMPATAAPGIPTVISATVAEKNGDTGATGDCRLYVNDALADEAPAIWVDAGDEVSCQFAHVFTQLGTYAVRVAIENVTPGDDDASNNQVTGNLVALANLTTNEGRATFREHDNDRETWSVRNELTNASDPTFLELQETADTLEDHSRYVTARHAWDRRSAGSGEEIAFPLGSIRVLQRSGDAVLADYTLRDVQATSTVSWDDGSRKACYQAPALAGQSGRLSVCTEVQVDPSNGQTSSRTWAWAEATRGHVQYLGRRFYRYVYTPYDEEYSFEAVYVEEDVVHGSSTVGELGPDMSWVFDVGGVHAGTGDALTYSAHLAEPWQLTSSETFDGIERCNTTRSFAGVWVNTYNTCTSRSGTVRQLDAFKSVTP